MGYKFQFITLAGIHSMWFNMYKLTKGYVERQMPAYVELQEAEFAAANDGYTFVSHQQEVGTGYFDDVAQVIQGGQSSVTALTGSTEEAQFRQSSLDSHAGRRTPPLASAAAFQIGAITTPSDDEHVHEFVHGHCFEPLLVRARVDDLCGSPSGKARQQVAPELVHEDRNAGFAPTPMANRILDFDLFGLRAVLEKNLNRIGDRTLVGLVVLAAVACILLDHHQIAQPIDARIRGDVVFVVFGDRLPFSRPMAAMYCRQ